MKMSNVDTGRVALLLLTRLVFRLTWRHAPYLYGRPAAGYYVLC
jgi:hypothetical protein